MPKRTSKEKFKSVPSPYLQKEIEEDLRENMEKFRDPIVLATIAYKLLEERENTNRILKNVLARLDRLEAGKEPEIPPQNTFLSEIDQQILEFVKKTGKTTARDVQKKLRYKGSNAASSRMNRLVKEGFLQKKQAGRKMYFLLR
ncbi:MAG: BlaI/MecI/CopY family transcriptional regulator [Candidatus Micrarchaeia archaeon]